MQNFNEQANFIWTIADLIRDTFKRGKYQDVILPFTVLRRIDSVLAPTKEAVLSTYHEYKDKLDKPDQLLRNASGYAFYNTSRYDFQRLIEDSEGLADNLKSYIHDFSPNMREVLERFDFPNTIAKLDEEGLLFLVMQRFAETDLGPDKISNLQMGYIFEELIRRFNEALNENPGEHFTPREVINLMVDLLLTQDQDELLPAGIVRTVYDPACGSGGMLTLAKDRIQQMNPDADIYLYGQEVNPETYAVAKSDLFIKSRDGKDAENIKYGSTLSDDQHVGERFDYQLSNPPYGKDWKRDQKAVEAEAKKKHAGRFGAGTPRISDGQLLFLQHMLSKMHNPKKAHSRVAIVMNGSPLFTGDAGSGESEIRRWILEFDWLEAIIALPEQLFYNTGIATYIWVLTNQKLDTRKGMVQLIDATSCWVPMRKSLGDKRREISQEHIDLIARLFYDFAEGRYSEVYGTEPREDEPHSKLFPSTHFGYRKIKVERPLRLNFQASKERINRLWEERTFANLARSRKKDPAVKAEEEAIGREEQEAIINMLYTIGDDLYTDAKDFKKALDQAATHADIGLKAPMVKAIRSALSEADPEAAIVIDSKKRPEPDSNLRDYENVPLDEDIRTYFEREVMPHVPDAWIDGSYTDDKDGEIGRVGYEINFNRYFYVYQPPRPLDEIEADIKVLEEEIIRMLREVTQ